MTDLMRPEDLKKVTNDAEMKKAAEHLKAAKKQEEEQKALLEMFMAREISPKASERINEAVRRAAEQGLNELQVITFASTYCNDRGRRINNNEPDWPESLARSIHAYTTSASLGRREFARRGSEGSAGGRCV